MTTPQTLAEQIRALEPPRGMGPASIMRSGWNEAIKEAAALADAAPPAEQAGDVGQAWRVKPLVWFEVEKSRYGGKYTADGYTIRYIEGRWLMDFGGHSKSIWNFSDLGAAQSAAQADYTARINAALEPDPTPPTALSGPPKDGRMLCLLVDYSDGDHPLEDAKQAWTIGYNTLADTGDDEWLIAGWSWEQDCYTDGRGTVIGWLPFPCDPTPALSWRAMQTAAIAAQPVTSANPDETIRDRAYFDGIMAYAKAILAITGPTADQLLEEAVKLEAVRELVRAAKWIGVVAQTTGGTAGPDIDLIEAIDVLANALAKIGGVA